MELINQITMVELVTLMLAVVGAFFAGMKWVDQKNLNVDKHVDELEKRVSESHRQLSDDVSRLRVETTAQLGALDVKSSERYATWQALREFKDDLKTDFHNAMDRQEKLNREQFDRLFNLIQTMRAGKEERS